MDRKKLAKIRVLNLIIRKLVIRNSHSLIILRLLMNPRKRGMIDKNEKELKGSGTVNKVTCKTSKTKLKNIMI